MPGPAPKRKDEALGHPREAAGASAPVDQVAVVQKLNIPEPSEDWCDIAKFAYQAFLDSPLKQFYTDTDVAYGWMTADAIHHAHTRGSAMLISAAESLMRSALFNEADRRRVRIEVTRKEPPANPAVQKNKDELAARRKARDAE